MILVDGKPDGSIPADDRGLAYGDGMFETIRARRGCLPLLSWHMERLQAGLHALRIPIPDSRLIERELSRAAAEEPDGVIKLIVTRGSGGRGYQAPAIPHARRIVQTAPAPDDLARWQEQGMATHICVTPLQGPSALAGLKHLNRLPQVLARAEWSGPEYDEGLMRDVAGRLVEGIRSNLFIVHDGELLAPPVGSGVEGVMRRLVLSMARRQGIETSERYVSDAQFMAADEIFLTNSVIGVAPVRQVEDRILSIGTMTRLLQQDVEKELEVRTC